MQKISVFLVFALLLGLNSETYGFDHNLGISSTKIIAQTPIQGDNTWLGNYQWVELGGKNTGIVVEHTLNISRNKNGIFMAKLASIGYQTNETIICDVKFNKRGERLNLLFRSYANGSVVNKYGVQRYKKGQAMIALERRVNNGNLIYLTFWQSFQPILKPQVNGRVYFLKT
jgi:hypothetical protein